LTHVYGVLGFTQVQVHYIFVASMLNHNLSTMHLWQDAQSHPLSIFFFCDPLPIKNPPWSRAAAERAASHIVCMGRLAGHMGTTSRSVLGFVTCRVVGFLTLGF